MADGKKTLILKGNVQHYEWGGNEFIPTLLGIANPNKKPFAEYWMGAHEKSPSLVESNTGSVPLDILIKENPGVILGGYVTKKFQRLPYLLKILDVRDMLSIQVHPSKQSAETEFQKENLAGIPLDAANRNYKDNNHKPELIVALNEFWLLHGFKPESKLSRILENIPEFESISRIYKISGLAALYTSVMNLPQKETNSILNPLLERIIPQYKRGELMPEQEDFWAARAALNFKTSTGPDRGIFSIYFLNLLKIKKGEGIFQPTGLPHAYLEGQNVEIMANSDNVLRGGLTTKYIDVKELIKQIRFEETDPEIILPSKIGPENIYHTSAEDFQLSYFYILPKEDVSFKTTTAEILFVLNGSAVIHSDNISIDLQKGQSVIAYSGQTIHIQANSPSEIYKASVPVPMPN